MSDQRYLPKERLGQFRAKVIGKSLELVHQAELLDHADYMDDLAKTLQQECEGIEDRCSEAAERVERLERELQAGAEVMQRQDDRLVDSESQLIAAYEQIAELEAQNRELVEALQFAKDYMNPCMTPDDLWDRINAAIVRATGPAEAKL